MDNLLADLLDIARAVRAAESRGGVGATLAALPPADRVRVAELLESIASRAPTGQEPPGGGPHGG